MTFYAAMTILLELTMITMIPHVVHYVGFTKQQKTWFLLTFCCVIVCSVAEFAVHGIPFRPIYALPLTIITVLQFSLSPLLAVFFSGALGLHEEAKRAIKFFALNGIVELIAAPFGWIFYVDSTGYHRGDLFLVYEVFYVVALLYLAVSMVFVGRRFRHRDFWTIIMVLVTLVAGLIPMTFANVQIAYFAIGLASTLCYIYYNDLVQDDIQSDILSNERQMAAMQDNTISGLANLIESRDTETGEHVVRTRNYVRQIAIRAREAGLYQDQIDDRFITNLSSLAPLHDVGKIVVPDRILRKPGPLTAEESALMKTHAQVGGTVVRQILRDVTDEAYLKFASDIATYHHEKWDGSGYPKGLSGQEIPLSARIMALADVYDALVTERCYKEAYPPSEAMQIIRESSGSHFDPDLAAVFLDWLVQSGEAERS